MYYVYILQSEKDGKLYVGCTKNLKQRIILLNSGKIFSTYMNKPFDLIYYEVYKDKRDAFEREQFFKTGWGRNYIRNKLKYFFKSKNLGG